MKIYLLKVKRTIRYLFYRQLNTKEQIKISDILEDSKLLSLYWNMSKADRQHSYEVFHRIKQKTNEKDLLLLSLLHDIGKSKIHAGLFFRILSDIGLLKGSKSDIYLKHESIGIELLVEKNIILDKTDY